MFPINHSNVTVNEGGVNPFKVRVGEDTVSWKVGEVRIRNLLKTILLNGTEQSNNSQYSITIIEMYFSLQSLTDHLNMKFGTH